MRILVFTSCLLMAVAASATDVEVNGLFKGRAVLTINGAQRLMKEGELSPEGVKLISSDSRQAVVEVDGERATLGLSQQISASYREVKPVEVRVSRSRNGHYFVGGFINGHSVHFMVDTGATNIALNLNDARRLGIDYRRGNPGAVSTAGGMVDAFHTQLDKVTVGNITLHQIPATVVVGDFPAQVLLGNSFLNRVEISEKDGVMVLRKKF